MSSSQIIECAPCYELKYDETLDKLRDQTFIELKILYGKNKKIKCNCWTDRCREYKVDSAFVAAHMKSQKHVNWREEQLKEHTQKYGHCISAEKIIETLRKEVRDYKKLHANSMEIISNKDEKLTLMSKKLDELSEENERLKYELEEYQEELEELEELEEPEEPEDTKEKIADIKKENSDLKSQLENRELEYAAFKLDLEEYQKDIISLTKEKEKLLSQLNSQKLKIPNRRVFR